MKRILAISGSRADYGLLEWPVKVLRESFEVQFERMESVFLRDAGDAYQIAAKLLKQHKPDCLLILGDRWEILQAAIAAHLQRIPIAHIGGGDVSLGSYDDAMRDCISVLASWNFATSESAADRMRDCHFNHVHMVGNIAIDYIRHGDWKRERPYQEPYCVVSYQAETIDGTVDREAVVKAIGLRNAVFIRPNPDAGSDKINEFIDSYMRLSAPSGYVVDQLPHGEFLNLIYHCELFIGNSSSMFYECPELGVKTQLIGKRQQGRVIPTGDGNASERIREILCRSL